MDIKFTRCGARPDGELLYRMEIDGKTIAEGLSLDQVIAAINRRDEEKLGEDHAPRPSQSPPRAAATASSECRTLPARQNALPEGASQGREPPVERRRKAALGPFRRR